jgi:hypothetical protein
MRFGIGAPAIEFYKKRSAHRIGFEAHHSAIQAFACGKRAHCLIEVALRRCRHGADNGCRFAIDHASSELGHDLSTDPNPI